MIRHAGFLRYRKADSGDLEEMSQGDVVTSTELASRQTRHHLFMPVQQDRYANNADAWLANGSIFSRAAKLLFEQSDPFLYFPAALLGQQALEMLLKAALIRNDATVAPNDVWGHKLVDLANRLTIRADFLAVAKKFDDFYSELLYPKEIKKVEGLGTDDGWHLDWAVGSILPYARPPKTASAP